MAFALAGSLDFVDAEAVPPAEPPPDADDAVDSESAPAVGSELDELRALVGEELVERSFLAQPEPLKWTVGAANVLRIVPSRPQLGQVRGPASLIPWRNSTTSPQALQA